MNRKKIKLSSFLKYNELNLHVDKSDYMDYVLFQAHSHDYCEIFIITSGSGEQIIGQQSYDLKAGDVFVIKGSEEHSLRNTNKLCYFNIMFRLENLEIDDCDVIPGFWMLFVHEQIAPFISQMHIEGELFQSVLDLCEHLFTEYQLANPGYASICRSLLVYLIVLLSRNYKPVDSLVYSNSESLIQAVIFMQNNFTDKVSLAELADIAGFSKRHFNRLFIRHYGLTPMQFLNDIRLNHALYYLKSSSFSISQIATLCGFQDSNYFSKCFKQKYKTSPSKWLNH